MFLCCVVVLLRMWLCLSFYVPFVLFRGLFCCCRRAMTSIRLRLWCLSILLCVVWLLRFRLVLRCCRRLGSSRGLLGRIGHSCRMWCFCRFGVVWVSASVFEGEVSAFYGKEFASYVCESFYFFSCVVVCAFEVEYGSRVFLSCLRLFYLFLCAVLFVVLVCYFRLLFFRLVCVWLFLLFEFVVLFRGCGSGLRGGGHWFGAVFFTHLTLPTKRIV